MTLPPRNRGRRAEDVYARWNIRVRDTIIFVVGVVGVVNEVFIVSEPRLAILVFLGSLIGVPFILNADEKRTQTNGYRSHRDSERKTGGHHDDLEQ